MLFGTLPWVAWHGYWAAALLVIVATEIAVIGHEVGQLSGLVERILRFAAPRDGRQAFVIEPLSPAEIVDTVLTSTGGLIRAAQFTVGLVPTVSSCRAPRDHSVATGSTL